MSEKRATTSGGLAAKTGEQRVVSEPIARLSDHLGRLLAHADQLLAEWKSHAESLRARFEQQGEAAGQLLARSLESALADAAQRASAELTRAYGANAERLRVDLEKARQAAADLEAHMRRIAGGAKPTSIDELRAGLARIDAQLAAASGRGAASTVTLGLALAGALLSAIVLVVVLRAPAPTVPAPAAAAATAPAAPPLAPVAVPPDAGVAPPAVKPPPPAPCAALTVEGSATGAKLALACVAELCGPPKPRYLADCKRDDAAGADLVAALRAAEREKPLARLSCKPDGTAVTVRWLLECVAPR